MKKLISILTVLSILLSLFSICLVANADNVKYRLQFTEKALTYDNNAAAWVKSPGDSVGLNYPGFSYVFKDGSATIRKFVAGEAGNLILWNWGTGASVDNSSGSFTGATFEFAITDADGDIIYPTNGDVATVTEGTPLNEKFDFGTVAAGDTFYFVAMNPSVNQLPIILSYDLRIQGGTVYTDSGRLYGGNTQGANGWHHVYADAVTKVDPSTLVPKTYALDFETQQMTFSSTYAAWSADGTSSCLIYPDATYGTTDNSLVAIRQFVMPEDGEIRLAWGLGVTASSGTAKFAITDKTGKIIYPADGGCVNVSTTPHLIDTTLTGLKKDDSVYLVVWDFSTAGAKVDIHTAFNVNNVSYAYNGCYPYGDSTAQGTNGWYHLYATSITEVTEENYRDMTALNAEIKAAEELTDLSAYTDDSVAAFNTALAAAKAITKANTQTEIDTAAANLKNAVAGLTLKPTAPPEKIVAFEFDEAQMTWDSTNNCWTAGEGKNSTTYPAYSVINKDNKALAIRKFVAPESGEIRLAWGLGASVSTGTAKFAIADKYKKVIYGPVDITAGAPHTFDITLSDIAKDDVLYFIVYDASAASATASVHTALNLNAVAYADNGNLWSSANTQGDKGLWYVYADNFKAIKESEYKNLAELKEQIEKIEAIPVATLAKCTDESVTALITALNLAKSYDNTKSQAEIDAMTDALKAAIKGLAPKGVPSDAKSVSFTEKLMKYNENMLYWTAEGDNSCIIGPAINFSSSILGSGNVAIRKLVLPKDGDLQLKWGAGVFIDNSSGNYTGSSAEFIIADKNGNIIYPATGGAAKITEGTPLVLDLTVTGLKRGDAVYFITLNPSADNIPVIYNVGAVVGGQALQNASGNLYGIGGAQGAKSWYYVYADDIAFSDQTVGDTPGIQQPEQGNQGGQGSSIPATGDSRDITAAAIVFVISAAVLLLIYKHRNLLYGKYER